MQTLRPPASIKAALSTGNVTNIAEAYAVIDGLRIPQEEQMDASDFVTRLKDYEQILKHSLQPGLGSNDDEQDTKEETKE